MARTTSARRTSLAGVTTFSAASDSPNRSPNQSGRPSKRSSSLHVAEDVDDTSIRNSVAHTWDEDRNESRPSKQPLLLADGIPEEEMAAAHASSADDVSAQEEHVATAKRWEFRDLKVLIASTTFDHIVGAFVLVNAAMLGAETDFRAMHPDAELPSFIRRSEMCFCGFFAAELGLRLAVFGRTFFTVSTWGWNVFDLVVVLLQLLEQASRLLSGEGVPMNVSAMQTVRVLRLARITRLIRALRLIEELRTIVSSIAKSMRSLFWSLVLLMTMVYTCSVLFTQIVTDTVAKGTTNAATLQYWFGGLGRTVLTMFETILGGVSWDEVIQPLITDVSPVAGFVFCLYVAFSVFALMNVVTGIFVEKATRTALEDKDQYMANHISDLFFKNAEQGAAFITLEAFKAQLGNSDMQDYFKAIDVDPSEAQGLFQLLDTEDLGYIYPSQFVDALLRLRGSARALDLSLLMYETRRMQQSLTKTQANITRRLAHLGQAVSHLASAEPRGGAGRRPQTDPARPLAEAPGLAGPGAQDEAVELLECPQGSGRDTP